MVMLAKDYDVFTTDPTGYWISEKMDGIRGIWTGEKLITRNQNVIPAPSWFTDSLPRGFKLDGELFIDRNHRLQQVASIVASIRDKGWKHINFMVFDIPEPKGGTFEIRQSVLKTAVKHINKPYIKTVQQIKCTGRGHLDQAFRLIVEAGGEGLMLRKSNSPYESRRSPYLLKYKKFEMAEAIVLQYEEGEGKNVGKMGALWCRSVHDSSSSTVGPNHSLKFKVGTGFTDQERNNPPPIGSIITYQYQRLTESGKPFHPSFICIRNDS